MAFNYSIRELRELADKMQVKTGVPFNQMSLPFLKRRLNLLNDRYGFRKPDQLYGSLSDDVFIQDLLQCFEVPVGELFRDPGVWRLLRSKLTELSSKGPVHIWLPHVASGEELFTLLIVLNELGITDKVKIMAGYLSVATRAGVEAGLIKTKKLDMFEYNFKRYEGKGSITNYLNDSNGGYLLNLEWHHQVDFVKGFITNVSPETKVDLILFRNVMLYYKKEFHLDIKKQLDKALKPGGLLCIGAKEVLPETIETRFECIDKKENVFQKYAILKD